MPPPEAPALALAALALAIASAFICIALILLPRSNLPLLFRSVYTQVMTTESSMCVPLRLTYRIGLFLLKMLLGCCILAISTIG
jgi:hypothetical protein